MVHGVEGCSEKIYWHFPFVSVFEEVALLWKLLIVPDEVDLREKLCITFGHGVAFEVFFED